MQTNSQRRAAFKRAQRNWDNMLPPDYDYVPPECVECGAEVEDEDDWEDRGRLCFDCYYEEHCRGCGEECRDLKEGFCEDCYEDENVEKENVNG